MGWSGRIGAMVLVGMLSICGMGVWIVHQARTDGTRWPMLSLRLADDPAVLAVALSSDLDDEARWQELRRRPATIRQGALAALYDQHWRMIYRRMAFNRSQELFPYHQDQVAQSDHLALSLHQDPTIALRSGMVLLMSHLDEKRRQQAIITWLDELDNPATQTQPKREQALFALLHDVVDMSEPIVAARLLPHLIRHLQHDQTQACDRTCIWAAKTLRHRAGTLDQRHQDLLKVYSPGISLAPSPDFYDRASGPSAASSADNGMGPQPRPLIQK